MQSTITTAAMKLRVSRSSAADRSQEVQVSLSAQQTHLVLYGKDSSCAADRFQEVLRSTRDDVRAPQGVVWKAMWRAHGRIFVQAGAVKFCHDCILFIGGPREPVSDDKSRGPWILILSFLHPQTTAFLRVPFLCCDGLEGHVAGTWWHLHAGWGLLSSATTASSSKVGRVLRSSVGFLDIQGSSLVFRTLSRYMGTAWPPVHAGWGCQDLPQLHPLHRGGEKAEKAGF